MNELGLILNSRWFLKYPVWHLTWQPYWTFGHTFTFHTILDILAAPLVLISVWTGENLIMPLAPFSVPDFFNFQIFISFWISEDYSFAKREYYISFYFKVWKFQIKTLFSKCWMWKGPILWRSWRRHLTNQFSWPWRFLTNHFLLVLEVFNLSFSL